MLDATRLARLAELTKSHLGYLRNTQRISLATCEVCSCPIDGYPRCYQCEGHLVHAPLADRVGAVTYAWYGHQSGRIMEGYKGRAGPVVDSDLNAVALLSLSALGLHTHCAERLAGLPVTHWTTTPSLPRKAGEHPLRRVVAGFAPGAELPLIAAETAVNPREVNPEHFTAAYSIAQASHVLILDDTWTQGGHAQSAALAVRAAGATQVSTLVLARWLKPGWGPTDAFLPSLVKGPDFDPVVCPWTGGECPW